MGSVNALRRENAKIRVFLSNACNQFIRRPACSESQFTSKMPHMTPPTATRLQRAAKAERARKILAGVARDDSDDELGIDDHPWEWIYEKQVREEEGEVRDDEEDEEKSATARRYRSTSVRHASIKQRIIGATMGSFRCRIGDTVLLKSEGKTAWVGIICEFMETINEDGDLEKAAKFMCKSPERFMLHLLIQSRVCLRA